MADIETTINAMSKKDTSPTPPEPAIIPEEVLTEIQIQTIAKELAQPWIYGTALHQYARRHGVRRKTVIRIEAALRARQAIDNPAMAEVL